MRRYLIAVTWDDGSATTGEVDAPDIALAVARWMMKHTPDRAFIPVEISWRELTEAASGK